MRFVIAFSMIGGGIGTIPTIVSSLRNAGVVDLQRDVGWICIACFSAMLGAVFGCTHAISLAYISAYKPNSQLKTTESRPAAVGFFADIYSMWSPPVGHARRDWRHRMQFRRQQAVSILIVILILGCLLAMTYFLSGD